ncbi:MAG: isoprenoid biosynthesis glyoxalase ElbB [Candidatus Marinimicrobia bacterium]|nr:isoprenoid biosynthesis glyoxalase ElbB [Candidatus Neomarinimicrobiota bacterium]
MPKVGVVLSGCGVYDGAEIHESVITMLALDRAGVEKIMMAPDIDQLHVINHLNGEEMDGDGRNVLVESARIARGDIKSISEVTENELNALIFPGGFGVAKNLSDYAMAGANCIVNPEVARLTREVHKAGKPIGVMCIAPIMMAKILNLDSLSADLTIGSDEKTANDINSMGSNHITCPVQGVIVDKEMRIVSTPAYMEAKNMAEAAEGIEKLVSEVLNMIK